MFRFVPATVLAISVLPFGLSAASASGPANTVTFQGDVFVQTVSSACAAAGTSVGDFYRVVYLYKANESAGVNDSLSFIGGRSAYLLTSTSATVGALNGSSTDTARLIGGHATYYSATTTSSLTIGSAGGNPTATAGNLHIVGSINDFYTDTGCNVTIRANLSARPN